LHRRKVIGHVIPALPLLLVAPGAWVRYSDQGSTRGYTEECRTSTPTYDGPEQRYITRAPRDTSPAGSPALSSVSPSAGLSTSPFLSLSLSLSLSLFRRLVLLFSLTALSRFAFPRGWIAARGYVRNRGTKCVRVANSSPPRRP